MAAVVSPMARWLFRLVLNLYKWICLKWLTIKQKYLYYSNNNTQSIILSESEQRIQNGKPWDEFCDTLKAAGAVVFAPGVPQDSHTKAEGYRYLSRLARAGLENWVECCDVEKPQLCEIANGNRPSRICIGSDNPDNLYQHATIDSRFEYEVTGIRGSVQYLSFGTQSGSYGNKGGLQTVDILESNELVYDNDDGNENSSSFKILLSSKQPNTTNSTSNWLRLNPNIKDALFIVRQTFGERSKEIPAKLSIRCITTTKKGSSSSSSNNVLTAEKLDHGLQQASIFVAGASSMFAKWSYEFKSNHTNTLPLFDPQRSTNAGGDPNIKYYHSYWDLTSIGSNEGGNSSSSSNNNNNSNKVLRIRFIPPQCLSWNFQLNNHWMESLDYRFHNIHTNSTMAQKDIEGRGYTIIISSKNPNWDGIFRGNWIDTVGHTCGTMCFRYVQPKQDLPEPPHVDVIDFESL